jgi:hypothetical protein
MVQLTEPAAQVDLHQGAVWTRLRLGLSQAGAGFVHVSCRLMNLSEHDEDGRHVAQAAGVTVPGQDVTDLAGRSGGVAAQLSVRAGGCAPS